MATNNKHYIETEKKLSAKDPKEVLKTLETLRVSGKANILPLIIKQLEVQKDVEITKEIISILGQLKDEEARPFIIQGIKSSTKKNIKKDIIMTCWQSGLDYSKYIIDFVEEFVKGDFLIAIEAFSVIEEWLHNSPKETNEACKNFLVENISKVEEDKKALYSELVKLFDDSF